MRLKHITHWVHDGLRAHLHPGDYAVDATLGNGHDAELMCACVGPSGRVWGLDIQAEAISASSERLAGFQCFTALELDHATLQEHLPQKARGKLRAAVFNLGYLPGADHTITTQRESTLIALAAAIEWLAPGGVLCCTCYTEHPHGREEAEAVKRWFAEVPVSMGHVTRIERVGSPVPVPFTFWLELHGERPVGA
jgi:predicted methyltransferase